MFQPEWKHGRRGWLPSSSGTYSIRSPGRQSSALQIASSVEKRIGSSEGLVDFGL